jgi:hypothetical protein
MKTKRPPDSWHVRAAHSMGAHPWITWGGVTGVVVVLGAVATVLLWVFAHFQSIADASATQQKIEAALRDHKEHDDGVQKWNQFGFADTRAQFLSDHAFECDAKKMMTKALAPVDAAVCARYEAQLKLKLEEASQLKRDAMAATKEKP